MRFALILALLPALAGEPFCAVAEIHTDLMPRPDPTAHKGKDRVLYRGQSAEG